MGFIKDLFKRKASVPLNRNSLNAETGDDRRKTDEGNCIQCGGTGKVVIRMSLMTGEKEYAACPSCRGTGKAKDGSDKYYTTYGNQSIDIARQLVWEHGKPKEIKIEGSSLVDATLIFDDGSEYRLGGFAVGYTGTRPDYLVTLLNNCGYSVNASDVETMKAPVILTRPVLS